MRNPKKPSVPETTPAKMIRMYEHQKHLLTNARETVFSAESVIREILNQGY
jgi:hypothetical protein